MTERQIEGGAVTTANPSNGNGLRRIAIDPISRVEGHGKVTLLLDEEDHVRQARLHIVEFRGFEKFIQGHPFWEVPILVQRLCGICPVSHHLAAAKAMDQIVGAATLTASATKARRLLHFGQILQSHALHFFYLASPDLLLGFDSDAARRNVVGVLEDFPDIALQGIQLRRFGQRVIEVLAGKRIHGEMAIAGGITAHPSAEAIQNLAAEAAGVVESSRSGIELVRRLCMADSVRYAGFGTFPSNFFSLVGAGGALELYDGTIRVKDAQGQILTDGVDPSSYQSLIREEVKSWSYMKFPFLQSLGTELGWYRVGPLARINNADFIPTPLAEAARQEFVEINGFSGSSLAYHWARMIELLHCAEAVRELLADEDIISGDLVAHGVRQPEGVGVIEAPRGTLIHHYRVGADDLVEKANLIVSTTHNNQAMNEAIRVVADKYLDGRTITEPLLNYVEVAIRAYDPCLSCATHAVGKMPLRVELLDAQGLTVDSLTQGPDGVCQRA